MKNRRKNVCVITPDGIVQVNKYWALFMAVVVPIIIGCVMLGGGVMLLHRL